MGGRGGPGASEEYLAQMGLVQFHAYALVDVRAESGFKLVWPGCGSAVVSVSPTEDPDNRDNGRL